MQCITCRHCSSIQWRTKAQCVPARIPISVVGMVLHVDATEPRLFLIERHLFFSTHRLPLGTCQSHTRSHSTPYFSCHSLPCLIVFILTHKNIPVRTNCTDMKTCVNWITRPRVTLTIICMHHTYLPGGLLSFKPTDVS